VVAADFKVPFFDFFLHRPFGTVPDRRATNAPAWANPYRCRCTQRRM